MAKTWKVGSSEKIVKRKHTYMPCILAGRFSEGKLTADEYADLMKRCYFSDYFTEAEWRTILNDSPKNPAVHRSNIRKKVAGWLIVINRLKVCNPGLMVEAYRRACDEYQDLIGEPLELGILPPYQFR